MKQSLLLLLLCLLSFVQIRAQETKIQDNKITVKDFYLDEKDGAANREPTIVYDQNGEKCALIKIITNIDGFSFDVGVLGVVETHQKPGEYWVYVPQGVKKITISHEIYEKLVYNLPYSTLKSKTYKMTLSSKEIFDNVVDDNTKVGILNLEIFPPTASVILNAIPVKLNERGKEQVQLYYGRYTYKVTDENYYPAEGRLRISNNASEQTIKLRLKQAFGWLDINCIEGLEGAEIFVDDKIIDSAVLRDSIPVKYGKHVVRIENPLYFPFHTEFTIEDSTVTTLPVTLKQNYGIVTLNTTDPLASIYVDGESVGRGSWSGKVAAGNHTFECKRGAHETTSRILDIGNGSNIIVPLEPPVPIYGTLSLTSTPEGANVYINDTLAGTTPLLKKDVIIGEKKLRIEKEFYTTINRMVEISRDSSTRLSVEMTNIIPIRITSNVDSANLYLNEQYIGTTPFADTLNGGKYALRLDAGKKYTTINSIIDVSPHNNTFHYKLKKNYVSTNEFYIELNKIIPTNSYSDKDPNNDGILFNKCGITLGKYKNNINYEFGFEYVDAGIESKWKDYWCKNFKNFSGNIGYGIPLGNRLRIAPQLGIQMNMARITGNDARKEVLYFCSNVSLRTTYAILPFLGISITPSYRIPIAGSSLYRDGSKQDSITKYSIRGFNLKVGITAFWPK